MDALSGIFSFTYCSQTGTKDIREGWGAVIILVRTGSAACLATSLVGNTPFLCRCARLCVSRYNRNNGKTKFSFCVQIDASCLESLSAWLHLLNSLSAGQSGRPWIVGRHEHSAKDDHCCIRVSTHEATSEIRKRQVLRFDPEMRWAGKRPSRAILATARRDKRRNFATSLADTKGSIGVQFKFTGTPVLSRKLPPCVATYHNLASE